jgi:hypothetical protein
MVPAQAAIIGNSNLGGFGNWLLPKFDWMVPWRFHSIDMQDLAQALVNYAIVNWQRGIPADVPVQPRVDIAEGESLFAWVQPPEAATAPRVEL